MPGKGVWLQHRRALDHSRHGGGAFCTRRYFSHRVCLQCWTCWEELRWKHGSQGFPPKRIWVFKGHGKQGRAISRKQGIPACLLLAPRPVGLSGEEQFWIQHWLPQCSPALWMRPPGLLPARPRLPSPPPALKPVVDVLRSCVLPAGRILTRAGDGSRPCGLSPGHGASQSLCIPLLFPVGRGSGAARPGLSM